MKGSTVLALLFVLILLIVGNNAVYVVPEGRQAIITQFGKLVAERTEAGCYFKIPLVQEIHMLEMRLLPWDGDPQDMPTKDKRRIGIDVWARWRIVEPTKFFTAVRTETEGQKRLDERVDSAVRAVVAKYNLIEVVRSSNETLHYESEELEEDWSARREQVLTGRKKMENELLRIASEDLQETFGMELVDVHIKRINYVPSVREKVYDRMRSERMRIASLFESEAEEERNRILGQTRKELDEIEGDMEQRSSEIRGDADAEVIQITAAAFVKSPEFYEFLRRLEAYKKTLTGKTRLVLSTKNEFLRQFHGPQSPSAE